MSLPAGTRRLFPGEPETDAELVLERLLEHGDSADLRWLAAQRRESELAAWLGELGGRRLSRRSRAFWALVLDTAPGPESPLARELWPL